MKIVLVSLLLSIFFAVLSAKTFLDNCEGPFFIDTSVVFARYEPLLMANGSIAQMENHVQKRMTRFDDSLSTVLDSLAAGNSDSQNLLELLNMESNVVRHKMLDSVRLAAETKTQDAYRQFDVSVASFCQSEGLKSLFGTASNFIVYGADGKADKTRTMLRYLGVADE
jgi:hypothetical protein